MSEIHLTVTQRQQLELGLATPPSTGFSRRALAILALDDGQPVDEVAELLGVSRQSIYNWVQAYQQAPGPNALYRRPGGGRPTLWTEPLRVLLQECLGDCPQEWDYPHTNWTVPLLREHLYAQTGGWLSEDTIRRQLQHTGYVWKRYRYVLPPDPEREKKTRQPAAVGPVAAAECGPGRR
jgi:transposase